MSLWERLFGGKKSKSTQPEESGPHQAPPPEKNPDTGPRELAETKSSPETEPSSTQPWKSRPVFLSSTFRDMHAERDWLNRRVFPRLEEELRRRRHHLEPIDLRLGVETAKAGTEEARELMVLKVCLDEIKRSKPFLLVMLGDRYGWVPPEDRIAAAAQEQGFETRPHGKSVTALEIEFGILREDPDQKQRSLFFFRRPLPYDKMPPEAREKYSDRFSPDPKVQEGHAGLEALKETLTQNPEFSPRVFHYELDWDENAGDITGLEAFGDLVYEKLWAALDEDTTAFAAQPAPSWEDQEREALSEFIEHRSRIFFGREELIFQLLVMARSPSIDGPMGAIEWGACIKGAPGSGKSAVLAMLHRELESDADLFLLAGAAGGTPRGSIVDAMLRRWIQELAAAAGATDSLPETAPPDEVEAMFYSLVGRVSTQQRVVALIDALDQFEPTPRGRYLTWFKAHQWPPNARIIATGLPCPAAEALCRCDGIAEIELPPLTEEDAASIGKQIWARYHREIGPALLRAVMSKTLPDGEPAYGNPLWLTLALEQLNLLDADDFDRADRKFSGTPTEKMAALLMDTAGRMPPDIHGLYGWLFAWNEKAFGKAHARGFYVALALSRYGWRETDLLDLVPRLGRLLFADPAVPDIDELALATLRRGFRAHIVRRGEHGQLDFFHAQIRRAIFEYNALEEKTRQALHAAVSDYLETLPTTDPFIPTERMAQLIGEQNALRAGRYYASLIVDTYSSQAIERIGSSWILVEWIAAGATEVGKNDHLSWICSWLDAPGLALDEIHGIAHNFLSGLLNQMEIALPLTIRLLLAKAIHSALNRISEFDPANAEWQHDLSISHIKIGDVLKAQVDLTGAIAAYRESAAIAQRQAGVDPASAGWDGWQRDLFAIHYRIGDVLSAQGDLAGALMAYRDAMAVAQRLANADKAKTGWQHDRSVLQIKIADVLKAQGDLTGALTAYRDAMAIFSRLVDVDPANAGWQRDLSVSHNRIGDVLMAQGDLPASLVAYRDAMEITQSLANDDPANAGLQRDLAVDLIKIGDAIVSQGELTRALTAYRDAMAIFSSLVNADPANAGWMRDLSISHNKIADVLMAQGDLPAAILTYRDAMEIIQRLANADPANAGLQRDLAVDLIKIGDALVSQGDLTGALTAYRDAIAIFSSLVNADPANAGWHRDLFGSFWRMAGISEKISDNDALQWWQKAYIQLSSMKKRGIMLPADDQYLTALKNKLER